jgi:hypothetical protein
MTLYVNRQAKQAAVTLVAGTTGCVLGGLRSVHEGALGMRSWPLQGPKAMEIVEAAKNEDRHDVKIEEVHLIVECTLSAKSKICFFLSMYFRSKISQD